MQRRTIHALIIFSLPLASVLIGCVVVFFFSTGTVARWFGGHEKTIEDIVAETVARRVQEQRQVAAADLSDAGTIRILLLGLDARKEDLEPHCDAIHLFSIDTKTWTMSITSVPRGTYAYIPKDRLDWEKFDKDIMLKRLAEKEAIEKAKLVVESLTASLPAPEPVPELTEKERVIILERAFISQESYLANACAFVGLEYGVEKIEGVLGMKADYLVTVGFSQTMGVLRLLDLPPTEALQWLRHRQSYAIGDPQRSHNQAVFIKDLIVQKADRFSDPLTAPLVRVFYSLVDTDMDFSTAYALLHTLLASGITEHPERITLTMKPAYSTADLHFDPEHPLASLERFYEKQAPHLSSKDFTGVPVSAVQSQLLAYLDARLASEIPTGDLMQKEIWLQVEDDAQRERIHFALIERASRALADAGDLEGAIDLASAFVIEKETLKLDVSAYNGRVLLAEFISKR